MYDVFEFMVMMVVMVGVNGWFLICVVLFKGCDECGMVWFINYESCKGEELVIYFFVVL